MTDRTIEPATARRAAPLRLRAVDADDLAVIAAVLQDAILPIADIGFDVPNQRFAFVANRFRWEAEEAERINAGIVVQHVSAVQVRHIDRTDRTQMLNLLTIAHQDGAVLLTFSDDRSIRVAVDRLEVTLEDIGEPWPTPNRPAHPEVP